MILRRFSGGCGRTLFSSGGCDSRCCSSQFALPTIRSDASFCVLYWLDLRGRSEGRVVSFIEMLAVYWVVSRSKRMGSGTKLESPTCSCHVSRVARMRLSVLRCSGSVAKLFVSWGSTIMLYSSSIGLRERNQRD